MPMMGLPLPGIPVYTQMSEGITHTEPSLVTQVSDFPSAKMAAMMPWLYQD